MTPDYERAAIKATEVLIKYNVRTAPVDPLPILKLLPGVFVMTFAEMSEMTNMERQDLIHMYGCDNQDAVTTAYIDGDKKRYTVAYNRLLPSRIIDMALARELGHIVLGHDGSRPEEVRQEEAKCFAHHLMCPRPLIHAISASNLRLTEDLLRNIAGCPEHCMSCIRRQPGVTVPAELNRIVRDNFAPYIQNFIGFQRYATLKDETSIADFGTYMDGYVE